MDAHPHTRIGLRTGSGVGTTGLHKKLFRNATLKGLDMETPKAVQYIDPITKRTIPVRSVYVPSTTLLKGKEFSRSATILTHRKDTPK